MKIYGFLLLQLAAFLFASQRVRSRNARAAVLRSFCNMLEQLRGLLETESSPMPELLLTLSKRCDGEALAFINTLRASLDTLGALSFQELWQSALRKSAACEDNAAYHELDSLGGILGRYELPAQLDAVSSCLEALRLYTERTRQKLPGINRLTWGLSFSGAALFGIILF